MYTIGSLADLISGKNTPNKPKIEVKQVESKPFKAKKDNVETPKSPKKSKIEKPTKAKKSPAVDESSKKSKKAFLKRKSNESGEENVKKVKLDTSTEETPKKSESKNATNAKKRMRDAKKKKFADPEKDSRTIFVGNVPISTQKKHIVKYFSKYGKIDTVRFRGAVRASLGIPKKTAFITKQFHPSATTMHCYVVFEKSESCQQALEANGQIFRDNHIRVDLCTASKDHEQKKAIFVGNIPFDAKEEDLWNVFKDCGEIESVRLVKDGLTGMGKGYGYVNFESSDSVELALELTDVKIKKRELRIKRANAGENKKRNEKGQKNRKVPRVPKKKPTDTDTSHTENEEAENDNNENTEEDNESETKSPKKVTIKNYQGAKFSDKKKKKKPNKGELKKKKISKILAKKAKPV